MIATPLIGRQVSKPCKELNVQITTPVTILNLATTLVMWSCKGVCKVMPLKGQKVACYLLGCHIHAHAYLYLYLSQREILGTNWSVL